MEKPLENTDIRFLEGREVLQIAVGLFQTIVHFDDDVSLSIEGQCKISDTIYEPGIEAGSKLLTRLGRTITAANSIDDRDLELSFDDGVTIRVVADPDESESFTLTAPGTTIVA